MALRLVMLPFQGQPGETHLEFEQPRGKGTLSWPLCIHS